MLTGLISGLLLNLVLCSDCFQFSYSRENQRVDYFGQTVKVARTTLESYRSHPSFSDLYCHTWIITESAIASSNYLLSSLQFEDVFSIDSMVPIVSFRTASPTGDIGNQSYSLTASTVNKEYTPEEILTPTKLGTRKFTRNCGSTFLFSNEKNEFEVIRTIERLLNARLALQHKDYFFVVGGQSLNQLMRMQQMAEIRYKISLITNGDSFTIENHCSRKKQKDGSLPLFHFDCDNVIAGQHIRAACTNLASMIKPDVKTANTSAIIRKGGGWLYTMFEEGSYHYNYTYEAQLSSFGGSSGLKRDGVWGGSIGDVLTRKADIAFGVGVTEERNKLVDPSALQTWLVRMFYVKLPEFRTDWWAILWPLQFKVWMAVLIVVSALVPVFVCSAVQYFRITSMDEVKARPTKLGIVLDVLDGMTRIFVEQAATLRHWKGIRVRFLIIVWTLFCLILETGYRSKLVSFLTFLDREQIPTTHLEISESNYKLFFRYYGGIAYRDAAASTNPMHKRILAKSELANSSIDCIYAVLLSNERTACLDFGPNFEYSLNVNATLHASPQSREIIVRSKDSDFKAVVVWAYRKYSPLTATFDKLILRSLASGLPEKWQHDDWDKSRLAGATWLREQNGSPVTKAIQKLLDRVGQAGPKSLPAGSLIGVYIIYTFGVGISIVSICIEIIARFIQRRRI